jgi:transcriptional regulator with XRE-family HTH domain
MTAAVRRRAAPAVSPPDALRALMLEHGLVQREVAVLAGVSEKTVESWLASAGAASHRSMPDRHLSLIRAVLPAFLRSRRKRS